MPILYIGSKAFEDVTGFRRYNSPDIDVIADFQTATALMKGERCVNVYPINRGKSLVGKMPSGKILEVSIAWPGSTNEELLEYCKGKASAPLNVLYALKMSHRYLRNSPFFVKTRNDIMQMRRLGAEIPDDLQDWFKRREKETYDYSHPSLAQNKQSFFSGDGVTYKYDHDSLHEAVAMFGEPLYRRYQKDGEQVACDREKWEALLPQDKQCAVAEEAAVLALERSLIPFPGTWNEYQAFRFALEKVCTSITSGWFREYAWEHYDKILDLFSDYPFKEMFEKALENGVVRENHN